MNKLYMKRLYFWTKLLTIINYILILLFIVSFIFFVLISIFLFVPSLPSITIFKSIELDSVNSLSGFITVFLPLVLFFTLSMNIENKRLYLDVLSCTEQVIVKRIIKTKSFNDMKYLRYNSNPTNYYVILGDKTVRISKYWNEDKDKDKEPKDVLINRIKKEKFDELLSNLDLRVIMRDFGELHEYDGHIYFLNKTIERNWK